MKHSFFQAAVESIQLYGCTTWTLTKRMEKKLDGNYTRMMRAILNKSWRQHPTKQQLYGHLPPITKTIQVRRTRHAGHCWRSDIPLGTPAGWLAWTYIQQLCEDTGYRPEDLPEVMNDREEWRESVRDIRAGGKTWCMYVCMYVWNIRNYTVNLLKKDILNCLQINVHKVSNSNLAFEEVMNDREEWRESVRDIRAGGTTWCMYVCMYVWNIRNYTVNLLKKDILNCLQINVHKVSNSNLAFEEYTALMRKISFFED